MKALLLAAGRGERLRPLTDNIPKCMVEAKGKPLLRHWIERLRQDGVLDLVINLHHLPEKVRAYFGDGSEWGVRITYADEAELLGTAGTIWNLRDTFSDERFVVIYADNLSDCGITDMIDFHCSRQALATVAACWIEDPTSCGIIGMDDEGRITRFLEKPTRGKMFSNYINAGIYVFEPEIFHFLPQVYPSDLSLHVLPRLLDEGQGLFAYCYSGYILKFDRPEDVIRSHDFLSKQDRLSR